MCWAEGVPTPSWRIVCALSTAASACAAAPARDKWEGGTGGGSVGLEFRQGWGRVALVAVVVGED